MAIQFSLTYPPSTCHRAVVFLSQVVRHSSKRCVAFDATSRTSYESLQQYRSKLVNSPKIFNKTGSAELRISTKAQLPITRIKGVLLGVGLILLIKGVVYNPMKDVATKYTINRISTAAPRVPNFDSEVTPKVNCYKKNISQ